MEPIALLDTREGELLEDAAKDLLDTLRPRLLRVIQQSQRLEVPPTNSWLGRVDARTQPFEASQMVRAFAHVSADNLRQTERILRRELPPFALYSLIRSTIEAASFGQWVLRARDEQLAASRTLRIYRQNIASDRMMWIEVVGRSSGTHDELHETAARLHRALNGIDAASFQLSVRSSAVVGSVDREARKSTAHEQPAFSGLEVWRICSSIVHANPVSMLNLLERHPDGDIGAMATRTSRLSFVASFFATACWRAEGLIELFRTRSRARRQR